MGRDCTRLIFVTGMAAMLAGCGLADSHAPLPSFMRASEPEPTVEAPPQMKRLVGDSLDSVFVSTSHPTDVRVSQPLHDPRGPGWTACVRAELTSVIGQPLGTQTYRIFINNGVVTDRRHVGADDTCATETYEPI